jgi:hypothetical protein
VSDIADLANDVSELFLRAALSNRKPVVIATHCEFCEDALVEILPNGARSRFCAACGPIAVAA